MSMPRMLLAAALLCAVAAFAPAQVTPPEEHLGHPVGADFKLPDWKAVSSYYVKLAQQSPRVRLEEIGVSTEGRDFLMATFSSERHMANLDAIKAAAKAMADPRGRSAEEIDRLVRSTPPIVMISLAMHASECAGTQFGLKLAHALAASEEEPWRTVRERCVVVMFPSTNPDGLDHVSGWYHRIVGTPYEAAGLPKLYQLYTGHDNNRDWFMMTQRETRLVTRQLYHEWLPQVYWDVHQQGGEKERFFVPPYRDPLNEHLDPALLAVTYAIGQRSVADMTREGFTGVSTGSTYDMWWNGGNRTTPVRHNIISFLTEAASSNLASPVFLKRDQLKDPRGGKEYRPTNQLLSPWPGGWWRMSDIIDYEMAFARSMLASVAREPEVYLRATVESAQRAIEAGRSGVPKGWVIPVDNRDAGAVRRMADLLMLGGVELHVLTAPARIDGREYAAGAIVIRRDQPYGQYVKDLFARQRFPEGEPPYDVAGWTLPLLMGVHAVEIVHAYDTKLARVKTVEEATAAWKSAADPLSLENSDTWRRLGEELRKGGKFVYADGKLKAGGGVSNSGGLVISGAPRVGLYAPHTGDMDEGWMRWVLEYMGVEYVSVRPEQVRAGNLRQFIDVLIFAGTPGTQITGGRAEGTVPEELARGVGSEGTIAIEELVRGGGRLIAVENSAMWAVNTFKLPITDATRGEKAKDFSCPGSVLRTQPLAHPLTDGLPQDLAVFFSKSQAFHVAPVSSKGGEGAVQVLQCYAPTQLLMSGWINKPEAIAGEAAWVRATVGGGAVHLFGYRPQYRAWSHAAFAPLMRAIYLDPAGPMSSRTK